MTVRGRDGWEEERCEAGSNQPPDQAIEVSKMLFSRWGDMPLNITRIELLVVAGRLKQRVADPL
jgi:hypothetical protein